VRKLLVSWECLAGLATLLAVAVSAAEPVRSLPAPPGQILDLRANAAGDLYVRTPTKVLWMDLQSPEEGWNALALDGVVDLSENAGHEVFARQDLKTRFAIHRLVGATATPVTTTPNVPCEQWYVDALGRAWLQNRERLLVVGKNETLLERPMGQPGYGIRFRHPCEWKPGHVALFFASEAVWATPEKVTAEAAPSFADDGTGNGPFLMGTNRLVAGGCNDKGSGSFLLDPRDPGKAPERLSLGLGDWFYGVATAPDGRLLVCPQRGFVWYAADGRCEVKLKEAGPILDGVTLREPGKSRVVFVGTGVGFASLPGGMLAIFRPDEAVMLTPATGLPLPRVEYVAAIGDDLIMAGGGKIVAWRTTEPLPKPDAADLREWALAGPCVRDVNGTLWAFLLDFPGKLSRHDGKQWGDAPIELHNLIPHEMTGDDKGTLQMTAADAPSGSALFRGGAVTNWRNEPVRAWVESMRQGATWFGDGSPFRLRHVAAGRAEWLWRYDGRSLWDVAREYDYYERPPYRYFWLGPDGVCYRGGAGQVWVFANGRWTQTDAPPLSIGSDGIRADAAGKDRRPVVYDGQLKLPLPGPTGVSGESKSRTLALQGNEAFIAGPGGGWVGQYRIFSNAYYTVAGRVYPGTNVQYLVADNMLRYQPRQTLKIEGEVLTDGNLRRLVCRIAGSEPLYKPRILAFLDGEFLDSIFNPDGADLPPVQPGAHTLEVYAADGFGVVSYEPLRLTLDGGPKFEIVNLEMGEEWMLKPQRLQALPATVGGRSVVRRSLEIDSDGVVWILVEGGVLSLDLPKRQAAFHRFPARQILSARGRVWALGTAAQQRLEWPIYELRREGIRHAVDLYDDASSFGYSQISADGQGGIWTLSHRVMTRWDGKRTQFWERPVGFEQSSTLVPCPDGAIIHAWDRYFHYRNGELSQGIPWDRAVLREEGYMDYATIYPLGSMHLVQADRQALVDIDTGQISERTIPSGDAYRLGANGDLYVWQSNALLRISGKDFAITRLPYVRSPTYTSHCYTSDSDDFLATTNGILAYPSGNDCLIMGREDGGAVEYGWRDMVEPGDTASIREAPDGRIWILRTNQLLVYDSAQPARPAAPAWPDWRAVSIWSGSAVSAFGNVWYITADGKTVVKTDGKAEVSWKMPLAGGFVIAGDQGSAMLVWCEKVFLLLPGGKVEPANDLPGAVLALVKRGAKAFAGGDPPVVAADGRVFFRGRIWDGQAWQALSEGRVSLDLRGNMFQLRGKDGTISVYRIDGCKATAVANTTKCLIDANGRRWYDPGLLEAKPGCLPVWYQGENDWDPLVSATPASRKVKLDTGLPVQAFPTTDGQFLLRIDSSLHVLDTNGLTALPNDRLPCGNKLLQATDAICPLADGRWAFGLGGRLFISPPNLRFTP
jgi:hypothetical protein